MDQTNPAEQDRTSPRTDYQRDRYMPIRKAAIIEKLAEQSDLAERANLLELARRLGLLFHVEYFSKREQLKELYIPFNPDQPGDTPLTQDKTALDSFLTTLHDTMLAANFTQIDQDELDAAEQSAVQVRAKIRIPKEEYAEVRVYGRGRSIEKVPVKKLLGLRTDHVDAVVYDHVVFLAVVKEDPKRKPGPANPLRPGAVYLKLFRDIPREDLNTLYPNARVVMKLKDKLMLGIPALVGGVPLLVNLLPAITVLFAVAAAYLGTEGAIEDDRMKQAVAAISGLVALGGFLMRQWVKYERQSLKYAKQVSDNVYFRNINSNAGFFDFVVGASEESEVKEALLAYTFLSRSDVPLTLDALDKQIEDWLTATYGVDVDFDEQDALDKLERIGLVQTKPDGLIAIPIDKALMRTRQAFQRLADEG